MTAHFLGGCAIGATPERGVVDPYHRVYGHPGLHVVDGSAVSPNLGVNPSLTITAQAERAMSLWPNKGEADPRPAPGEAYRPVAPRAARAVRWSRRTRPAALRLLPLTVVQRPRRPSFPRLERLHLALNYADRVPRREGDHHDAAATPPPPPRVLAGIPRGVRLDERSFLSRHRIISASSRSTRRRWPLSGWRGV